MASSVWLPGEKVGGYALVAPVARGGMGEVWLARELAPDRPPRTVVVKRLLEHLDGEGRYAHMLLDEARIAAQLHHPHIVQLLALGRDEDSFFLVMEHLDGENLSVALRRARSRGLPLSPECVAYVGAQIARALTRTPRST